MTIQTDVLIIGAGPCGLFQVFELGLLDLRCHLVDSLPQVGGQCSELYPEKPIYDIPAWPKIGAQELVDKLMEQIAPFDPVFHLDTLVTELDRQDDGSFIVRTDSDTCFHTRTIIIAGGLGSFEPRRLKLPMAAELEGTQLHYKVRDPAMFADQDLVILGGGDSALDWTIDLAPRVRSLTLLHRRADYRAQPASVNRMQELAAAGQIQAAQGNVTALHLGDGRLKAIDVVDLEGESRHLELDHLLIFWGMSPKLGPIADWNLGVIRNQVEVRTDTFETSIEGIYAVGDINTYPGKKKLILCGFHEAALAAFAIRERLFPDQKTRLQYTTTSPVMHQRLGVD